MCEGYSRSSWDSKGEGQSSAPSYQQGKAELESPKVQKKIVKQKMMIPFASTTS